jgi:nicotinamidase-related amidase
MRSVGTLTVGNGDIAASPSQCDCDCGSDSSTSASHKGHSIRQVIHRIIVCVVAALNYPWQAGRFPIQAKMRFDSLGRWNFTMQRTFGLNIPQTLEEICDPTRLALVVYDMQVGIVKQIENGQQITDKVLRVLDAARKAGIRVFFTRHMSLPRELMGVSQFRMAMAWQRIKSVDEVKPWFLRDSPGFPLIPEINPLASEAIFDKIAMSAFEGTPLDIALRDCGINAFAIIGIAMEIGIEPTVRHGADLGYIPVVVKDACGFGHRDAADRSIASLEFAGDALLTNADTFCAQLGRNPSP